MTQTEINRAAKAAAKRVVQAEKELDRATEGYDRVRDRAHKYGLLMPKTILSNPLMGSR